MAFTRALYYPSIDITNENWLKTAILYWDEINTIVPSSMDTPYQEETTRYLSDEGIIRPLHVNPDMNLIDSLADDVLNYLHSSEGRQLLTQPEEMVAIHSQKISREIRNMYRIHSEKMGYALWNRLRDYFDSDEWFQVSGNFGYFYMTLLTNKLCEHYGIAPLTDNTYVSNFNNIVRLDNQIIPYNYKFRLAGKHGDPEFIGPQLAQGVLTDLVFESISVSEEVSIEDILKFKRRHQDELGLFRVNIENLTKNISSDTPFEQLQQQVHDIYVNQFQPGYNDLKKSLKSAGIKSFANNFIKISFFSTGAAAIPSALLGLSIPCALLAGATTSIISSVVLYNEEKQEILRKNPYSYLLAMNNGI